MGVMDIVRGRRAPDIHSPRVTRVGASFESWWAEITSDVHGASPAKLFRTQPHLHTVVSFLARNVAQLGLHTFERVDESDRRRDRTSPIARALTFTDGTMTTYELIYALVGDLCLYDRAFWFIGESAGSVSGYSIRRLPPSWVTPDESTPFEVKSWLVALGDKVVSVPADQVLCFTGYSPTSPFGGSPTVEALRATLQEQVEAASYRAQVWKRGGRVSSILQRPADAPEWSDAARESFREDWYAKYTGRGSRAGGTPLLEDGMTLQRIDFNAQEQQFVEAAKLSLVTVAAAFHTNPTMIGQNDGANYSNVREFRKMLYGDTLGPILAQVEARINTFLLPMLGMDSEKFYVEFNIAEKLQGSFEEQSAALQSATGAPWLLRSEARAMMNLPSVEGADDLVVPLNVLIGGQASALDSGSQNRRSGPARQVKSRAPESYQEKYEEVLGKFFARQATVVKTLLGSKASADWWDADRWDIELAADLFKLHAMTAKTVGLATVEAAGVGEFDPERTLAYLKTVAANGAANINEATRSQIADALDDDEPTAAVANVFETAKSARVPEIAATCVTFASAFGAGEAGRQNSAKATKTWVVTSGNPRASHAAMDGETVPVDELFSNGLKWPGGIGDPDEVAGCQCELEINF